MPADDKVSIHKDISSKDFGLIADAIVSDLEGRRKRRADMEKKWAEVDRQLAMTPETSHKKLANGRADKNKAWMPEVELPLQAQTLEMLTADAKRLKFPANRDHFQARAALTEKYLMAFDKAGSPFPGERGNPARVTLNQDNADQLVQGLVSHWHSLYDYRATVDVVDAQAFSYGFGVGRIRMVSKRALGYDARAESTELKTPMLLARDVKKIYLDDSQHAIMHEGENLGPNILQCRSMNLADLKAAAESDDSYLKDEIKKLAKRKDGTVELVELEGDLVIDRSSETLIIQDVCVTVAIGAAGKGGSTAAFVRYQEGEEFSTYIVHQYHMESPDWAYGTSPLVKGMPIAKVAAQALNRVMESGALKNLPPVGYPKDDIAFANSGGPVIFPGAQWASIEDLKVYLEVGGDPKIMFDIFVGLVNLYYDVTGVNQPRLGAQTKSHTTAFAKDVELSQGAVRTVDYVRANLEGPMTRFLELEYRMGLRAMGRKRHTIYIQPWNEFVQVSRNHMPDIVKFLAIGSGAPAEDQAKMAQKMNSAQLAMNLDMVGQQQGRPPVLDIRSLIEITLSEGGWSNVGAILVPEAVTQGAGAQPGMGNGAAAPGAAPGGAALPTVQ